jgi:hypothetical protein
MEDKRMGATGGTSGVEKDTGYEKVWLLFREIAERQAETDRLIKELSKNIGGLNNAFGKWAEELVSAKLWEKFKGLGYQFTRGESKEFWEGGRTVAQVLLENGEYAMAVEIKSELGIGDVDST